jgi:prolycopene isomerase
VVCNADMTQAVERLLGPDDLPPDYVAAARGLRPTFPCFLGHIGVRDVPTEVLQRVHGYHWRGWDSDRVGLDALRFKLFVPTLYEPTLAPPGGHVVIVQKVTDVDFARVADWHAHKDEIEREALDHIETLIPGFRKRIVVQSSASAATSERFTWNRHGAMLGWEMSPEQLGAGRPDIAGPVENLFFTGHWTRPGGGITPVLMSALRAAEAVLRTSADAAGARAAPAAALA